MSAEVFIRKPKNSQKPNYHLSTHVEHKKLQPYYCKQDVTQGLFLSEVQLVWIQFSKASYFTKAKKNKKKPQCILLFSYSWWRAKRDGFIPFLRALAWTEIQTASSKIWTWVAESISYNDKSNTKCFSFYYVCMHFTTPKQNATKSGFKRRTIGLNLVFFLFYSGRPRG